MSLLNQLAPNSLTRSDIPVDEDAPSEGTPNSFVDGRNHLFLSYAAVFAKQRGITDIITGVSQSDFSGYPDCRDIFIKSLNTTLSLAMDYPFDIITPLMWLDKKETWALADELGVFDIIRNETLTCYNGVIGDGCGHCPSCKLRRKGLEAYLEEKNANRRHEKGGCNQQIGSRPFMYSFVFLHTFAVGTPRQFRHPSQIFFSSRSPERRSFIAASASSSSGPMHSQMILSP